ncbi:hypothetical protein [Bifidobacterium sp. ESL0790]|uniref:hypothetical protein n=1 Tax=Bifidobacterium sp. ESL0790 TaxID=2983233 RepID=UPI0023F6E9C8|nr:hypothetical protein [Bifidobacterium sp. ESL0790]WEV72134.1 hypothetical protein OZY47_06755 [Bifidobacterium sp. ESL0790]
MSKETTNNKQITIEDFHVGDVVRFEHHGNLHEGIVSEIDVPGRNFRMVCDQCDCDHAPCWNYVAGDTSLHDLSLESSIQALREFEDKARAKALLSAITPSIEACAQQAAYLYQSLFSTPYIAGAGKIMRSTDKTRLALADLKEKLQ